MNSISKIFILIIGLLLFSIPACNNDDQIPYVQVNLTLYLNTAEFQELKVPGNWANITGGVRGIIVFCPYDGEYLAFERNCPYEPSNDSARVEVDETGMFAVCPDCGSKFNLYDGSVVDGPAGLPLRQYTTSLENDVLYIYNRY